MYNLIGIKNKKENLVAQFSSEQQLLSYVRWATLECENSKYKFEQKTPLTGYTDYKYQEKANREDVPFNPSPSML